MKLDPNRRQFLKNVTRTAAGVCGVGSYSWLTATTS